MHSTNQRFVLSWYSNALFHAKSFWFYRDRLKPSLKQHQILWGSHNLLQNLSYFNNSTKITLGAKNKLQQMKIKSANKHLVFKVANMIKQYVKPKFFISQDTVLYNLKL